MKVAETDFVLGLTLVLDKDYGGAAIHLHNAYSLFKQNSNRDMVHIVSLAMKFIPKS